MHKIFPLFLLLVFSCKAPNIPANSNVPELSELELFTGTMEKSEGFFNYFYDEPSGKIFLEVDNLGKEFLYVNSLAAGVGSNDIGLDRGQLGNERVVKFEKHGNKLLMVQPNQGYRAVSNNQDEVKSVAEAFASSVLGGFTIASKGDKSYLIDITNFVLRDAHGVKGRLSRTNQGNYNIDQSRSAVYMDATMNFPKNTEIESIITFSGTPKGAYIRSVVPSPDAVTVRMHHSFIELPDDAYTPRVFDPRSGFGYISYQDYATPIEDPLVKRFIRRHRLEKKDPNAAISEAIEPIVYYLDRGAPEPVKSALLDGAKWWNQAFEAAGFKDAFQVKVLPEGVHPLDVRYNVIQWVHRSTRGWSYGASVVDPRTGEILKGHVSLGSLRVRQDFLIATGLLQPYENGNETPDEMTEMALARLRQLSAHEVGHTIGLAHNFASSMNERASVMDYPHPLVKMDDNGNIDLSEAYDDKIGIWDKVTIAYGYSQFPEGENEEKLRKILNDAFDSGLRYVTDQDARPVSGLNPHAHLWDNGTSAADELNRMMKIRRKILDNFSEKSIKINRPLSTIEEVLVPMYLFHRYQVDATSKLIGGLEYGYTLRGIPDKPKMLTKDVQMDALKALLNTIDPAQLKLSSELLGTIPPRAFGFPRTRETFQSKTGPAFDYLAAVETAASLPFYYLLNVDRANRLVMYKAMDTNQPGLQLVLDKTVESIWKNPKNNYEERTIQKIVETEMLKHLMNLAINIKGYAETRGLVYAAINSIQSFAQARVQRKTNSDGFYYQFIVEEIDQFMKNPKAYKIPEMIKAPDGSPIGSCDF